MTPLRHDTLDDSYVPISLVRLIVDGDRDPTHSWSIARNAFSDGKRDRCAIGPPLPYMPADQRCAFTRTYPHADFPTKTQSRKATTAFCFVVCTTVWISISTTRYPWMYGDSGKRSHVSLIWRGHC